MYGSNTNKYWLEEVVTIDLCSLNIMGRCAQSTFIGRSDWQSIYPASIDMTAEWFIILLDHSAVNHLLSFPIAA